MQPAGQTVTSKWTLILRSRGGAEAGRWGETRTWGICPRSGLRVTDCLSRYTHRVAISNQRLISFEQDQVTFGWRDSAHGNQQRLITLELDEVLRRFLLHVAPSGFVRIRYYGFLTNCKRGALLPLCRRLMLRRITARAYLALPRAPYCSALARFYGRFDPFHTPLRPPNLALARRISARNRPAFKSLYRWRQAHSSGQALPVTSPAPQYSDFLPSM